MYAHRPHTMLALGTSVVLAALAPRPTVAQDETDRAEVLAVVDRLFDGMRANDGDMVRSTFVLGAILISTERDGAAATTVTAAEQFASAVDQASQEWDEPYWDPIVQIEDHLASVWIKYAFYVDGQFTHCGVDAFLLARGEDGWKIAALADTRERDNCELPPSRQPEPFADP